MAQALRLIHITDPHLTSPRDWKPGLSGAKRGLSWLSWQTKRRSRHRRDRLDALTRSLGRYKPDCWAITGDLCQIGLDAEIREAADWLNTIATPDKLLVVPGNHDVFASDSLPSILRHWSPFLHIEEVGWPVVRRLGDIALIGINSAVVTPILMAGGSLGDDMRQRLAEALSRHQDCCRVVLIHHPPDPGACKARKALADAPQLTELLKRHGAALIRHGHLHRNRAARIDNGDRPIRIRCTASASAAGQQGAASARLFDIQRHENDGDHAPDNNRFRVREELLMLDAGNRLHAVESKTWLCRG